MAYTNIFDVEFEYDEEDPEGYRASVVEVGAKVAGAELAVRLFEVQPGQSLCPYHYEYAEEWMLVLHGAVSVRTPDGEQAAPTGTLGRFPAGPEGAHKLTNSSDEPARVLMWSSARVPAVAVYPDSDKIAVWPGNDADEVRLRRADGNVPYFDGEV
jgi:uncharacterized cupin superfamily protein